MLECVLKKKKKKKKTRARFKIKIINSFTAMRNFFISNTAEISISVSSLNSLFQLATTGIFSSQQRMT